MQPTKILITIFFLIATSLACLSGSSGSDEIPEPEADAQKTLTAQAGELAALAEQATADSISAAETRLALEVILQGAAETDEATIELGSETTEIPAKEPASSEIEPLMADELQALYDEGVIPTTEGEYIAFEDWTEAVADMNTINWWATDYEPASFVIRASSAWESASDSANWFNSGCGFLFGQQDDYNFHLIYLALDGVVYYNHWVDREQEVFAQDRYGTVGVPDGSADILLAVDGRQVTYYVNGEQVINTSDSRLRPGRLSFTVMSGTNKGFGTRCTLTDIGLFIIE